MDIYEIFPGKYSVKYPDEKAFVVFVGYNSLDKYSQQEIIDVSELKPHHRIFCKKPNCGDSRKTRIDWVRELLEYEVKSYSSVLR